MTRKRDILEVKSQGDPVQLPEIWFHSGKTHLELAKSQVDEYGLTFNSEKSSDSDYLKNEIFLKNRTPIWKKDKASYNKIGTMGR